MRSINSAARPSPSWARWIGTHHHEAGHGWSFASPDLLGLIGGIESDDFGAAREAAEAAARFHFSCEVDEGRRPVDDVAIEHYVPTDRVAAFA